MSKQLAWLEQLEEVKTMLVQWQVLENKLRGVSPVVGQTVAFAAFGKYRRKVERCLEDLRGVRVEP